jgi:N-acetylneuraminic acid mutarotase
MTKTFFTCISMFCLFSQSAQNFTWLRGDNIKDTAGVYGTLGVSSPANDPGSRHGAATWTDASGNLWLFGGEGFSSANTLAWLNDLWKYDISSNEWTWVRGSQFADAAGVYGTQGVPASGNDPGAREFSVSWTDNSGNFWLFGGEGFGSGTQTSAETLGDLWKYDPSTNQWTFMKGYATSNQPGVYGTKGVAASGNLPPSRASGTSWIDNNGKLWMFGGRGAFSGPNYLNDLWKYDPSTNEWTWVSGSNTTNQVTVHGTLGVAHINNIPGAREFPASWTDAQGNLLMFGGLGRGAVSNGWLSDMWKYDIANNVWTWINGSNLNNVTSVYGPAGVFTSSTMPGGRHSAATWKDKSGTFWFFGGNGYSGNIGSQSDLFKYEPVTNRWAYMKGPTTANNTGVYGTMGVPHTNNIPGGRYYNSSWREVSDAFYLIGGRGYDTATAGDLNDLWRYIPPCNPDSILPSLAKICAGGSATLTAYNQLPSVVQWYTSATGGASVAAGTVFTTPTLSAVGGQSVYTYYASANSCTMAPRTAIDITVHPLPVFSVSGPTATCSGNLTTFSATSANNYSFAWSDGSFGNTTQIVLSGPSNPTIICQGTDTNGCVKTESLSIMVYGTPTLTINGPTATCAGNTITLSGSGAATYTWHTGSNLVTTTAVATGSVYISTLLGTSAENCENSSTFITVVNPLPTLSTSIKAPEKFCENYTATITVTGAANYNWSTGQTGSVVAVSPSVTTTYTVTGTDINGCASTALVTQTTTICTGIGEFTKSGIEIFPNPVQGQVYITVDAGSLPCHMTIINSVGQLLNESNLEKEQNVMMINAPPGVYYVTIIPAEGKAVFRKLIVY